jgi:hypothetical protein
LHIAGGLHFFMANIWAQGKNTDIPGARVFTLAAGDLKGAKPFFSLEQSGEVVN